MPIPFSSFQFITVIFFLAHTTLWGRGDGIQLSKNSASSYQERKMFAPFAQALAVKYLMKCLQPLNPHLYAPHYYVQSLKATGAFHGSREKYQIIF